MRILAITILFLLAGSLFAQPTPRPLSTELTQRLQKNYGFSEEEKLSLREKGETIRFQGKDFSSLLLPDKPLAASLLRDLKDLKASIVVEALFVVPVEKGLPASEDFRLQMYNILHRVSTMKGIQYWSQSNQRMQVMFRDAYIVADPKSKKPLPNPVAFEISDHNRMYVYQDDSRFGENTYDAVCRHNEGKFWVSMKNLTRMYYGIFPVVAPGNLRLDMIILPGEDYLIFYSLIGADVITFFGMEERVLPSFSNRLAALFSWFQSQLKM